MRYLILLIACSSLLTGCEKIIAEDITGQVPVLILPASGSILTENQVQFKWEEMEGASKYHLMVVTPSFANPQEYTLDTIVSGTEFSATLDSNSYELKLVALNGGYRSDTLGPIPFEVNLAGGANFVTLLSPVDGAADNANFPGVFTWQSLSGATSYEFALKQGTDFTIGTLVDFANNIVTNSTTTPATLTEGEYIWGVKAYFGSGETAYTTHTFVIDTTTPNQPVLGQPLDASTQTAGTITFEWNNGTDGGSVQTPVTSRLEIANNTGFTNAVQVELVGDTHDETINTSDTYYWRVINIDEAGNESIASDTFSFTIN
ncbi:MAG: hypothetical protein NXI10_05675 [bacterium]|nr:hypothetical protein [bacterium]